MPWQRRTSEKGSSKDGMSCECRYSSSIPYASQLAVDCGLLMTCACHVMPTFSAALVGSHGRGPFQSRDSAVVAVRRL